MFESSGLSELKRDIKKRAETLESLSDMCEEDIEEAYGDFINIADMPAPTRAICADSDRLELPMKLREAYEAFLDLCRDQHRIHKEGHDLACLQHLFEGCTWIREVTIVPEIVCERKLSAHCHGVRGNCHDLTKGRQILV
jgi:hypothetical protein